MVYLVYEQIVQYLNGVVSPIRMKSSNITILDRVEVSKIKGEVKIGVLGRLVKSQNKFAKIGGVHFCEEQSFMVVVVAIAPYSSSAFSESTKDWTRAYGAPESRLCILWWIHTIHGH